MALGVLMGKICACASAAIKSTAGASVEGIGQKSEWLIECDPLMNSVTKLCKTKVCILHKVLSAKINKNKKRPSVPNYYYAIIHQVAVSTVIRNRYLCYVYLLDTM